MAMNYVEVVETALYIRSSVEIHVHSALHSIETMVWNTPLIAGEW
jgi:hypothetical protein